MSRQMELSQNDDLGIALIDALQRQRDLSLHWSLVVKKSQHLEILFTKMKNELEELKEQPEELQKEKNVDAALANANSVSNSSHTLILAANVPITSSTKKRLGENRGIRKFQIMDDTEKDFVDVGNNITFSDSREFCEKQQQKKHSNNNHNADGYSVIRKSTENHNSINVDHEKENCHLAIVNNYNVVSFDEKNSPKSFVDTKGLTALSMAPSAKFSLCTAENKASQQQIKPIHGNVLDRQGPLNVSTIITSSFLSKRKSRAPRTCKSKSPRKRSKSPKTWRRIISTRRLKSIYF